MLRARLFRLEPTRHVLFLNLHHIAADGWSVGVLLRELGSLYEAFFNGHFPDNPVMPGVIQIEAMGQAGALLAILSGAEVGDGRAIYVATISECKFRKPIVPGDVLELRARVVKQRMGMWKLQCEVWTDGEMASEALVTATAAPAATKKELPPGLPEPKYG